MKNPNWQKATSCQFTSVAENLNSGRPRTNPQVARAGREPGTAGLRVRRADPSATLPPLKETAWIAPWLLEVSDAWISSIFLTLVYGDSRVILSNQKTGFTRLAETWFVVRPNWTCVVNSNITFHLVFNCSCVSKKRCTFLVPVLL